MPQLASFRHIYASLRRQLRSNFFSTIRHVVSIDDTRQMVSSQLRLHNVLRIPEELRSIEFNAFPYSDVQAAYQDGGPDTGSNAVFVTGRFRSGSTLLWNIFRNIPDVTAYYEPFNERRWFDAETRGTQVDPSHVGVTDYWSEYDGLDELDDLFDVSWKFHHLYMPAEAWNPRMRAYISTLIRRARGRPVLQFNEVDFRLPWLRRQFPEAKIVHIYRHPRDQWCSTLGGAATSMANMTLGDFDHLDGFYLRTWANDLKHYFPFIDLSDQTHPYEIFYQIWRLSHLFGRRFADLSISYEDLVNDPRTTIESLVSMLSLTLPDPSSLQRMVSSQSVGRWRKLADHDQFVCLERRAEASMSQYLGWNLCGAVDLPPALVPRQGS
jgi:hypothetical protein